jgi:Family of unknown function (DUF6404)
MGTFFGILWGAFMWLLQWQAWRVPLESAIIPVVFTGAAFGLSMAAYYRWKAARLHLPSWENYPDPD